MALTLRFALVALLCMNAALASPRRLRRRTQGTVPVEFSVQLKATLGEDPNPVAITSQEKQAAKTSFERWFHENSVEAYLDIQSFAYHSTVCQVSDAVSVERSLPLVYSFDLDCQVKFLETGPIPEAREVVNTASNRYPKGLFVTDYFRPAMPPSSRFTETKSIIFLMRYRYSPLTEDPAPMMGNTPSITVNGTGSYIIRTSPPQPTGTMPMPSNSSTQSVEMILRWDLGAPNNGNPLRQPTTAEYNEFLGKVQSWMTDTLNYTYNYGEASSDLATFVSVDSTMVSTNYNATSQLAPHSMIITSLVEFVNVTEAIPMWQWVGILRRTGLTGFLEDYLNPTGSIFAFANRVMWQALDNL